MLLVQRSREREREELNSCFSKQGPIVHWNSFPQLVLKLGHSEYDPSKWRLCIDASKRSLKSVIYNESVFASVLVAHSVFLKESYENIETLLSRIKYQEHNRKVCGDFETLSTGMLLREQSECSKYSWFVCQWDSRERSRHWIHKKWLPGQQLVVGSENTAHSSLVPLVMSLCLPFTFSLRLWNSLSWL